MIDGKGSALTKQRYIQALKESGYDGLVYENREEDYGKDSYCIFSSEQVVSAIGFDWEGELRPTIPALKPNMRFGNIRAVYDPNNSAQCNF